MANGHKLCIVNVNKVFDYIFSLQSDIKESNSSFHEVLYINFKGPTHQGKGVK